MQFVHQALTWGFLLALLPLLIHLINLVRRRRVKWAAMDFLLQSYRKHRTWIWLKQLLLLMARIAVVLLAVAMLAQWITQQQWFALLGGTSTHHYVLLDDSFSMSDRVAGTTALDRAKQALAHIAAHAIGQETRQKLTLIRFSRADAAAESDATAASIADFNGELVDGNFDVLLEQRRREIDATELAVGPLAALQVVRQLVAADDEENDVVYLLSDFRERDWNNPAELRQQLDAVGRAGAEIHFVSCASSEQPNLAIVDMQPASDTRAAGVPLFVNIRVRNFGRQTARKVPVRVRTFYYDPRALAASQPGDAAAREDEPPAVLLDEVPPGQTVSARTQVFFPQAGAHVVEAVLPDDPVETDNRRWSVIDLVENEPVLVVDPTPRGDYFLQAAFEPGQRANTGVRPEVQPASFLRDTTPAELQRYRAVYLLDVDRLDERALANLETFVRDGGGLGIFLGEHVNVGFYNSRFYREGQGLFPLPLERDQLLADELFENTPDFEVEDHPIFGVFLGEDNPFIRLVTIERYFKPREDWAAETQTTAKVIARLRNRDPLAVERSFGRGRVVAVLTTLSPQWNNWAHDPSFVVVLLKLQAYLSAPLHGDQTRLVGSPLEVQLDAEQFRQDVVFLAPRHGDDTRLMIERPAAKPEPDSPLLVTTLGGASSPGQLGETVHSGIYEAWAPTVAGPYEVQRFAVNVDADEGNLATASSQTLAARLSPVKIRFRRPDQYAYEVNEQAGANRSLLLMCILIAILLAEQLLGYFTSYHPARGVVRA